MGEDSIEAEAIGLCPQLKREGGALSDDGMVEDGFEGRDVEDEVLLVEEKSCER